MQIDKTEPVKIRAKFFTLDIQIVKQSNILNLNSCKVCQPLILHRQEFTKLHHHYHNHPHSFVLTLYKAHSILSITSRQVTSANAQALPWGGKQNAKTILYLQLSLNNLYFWSKHELKEVFGSWSGWMIRTYSICQNVHFKSLGRRWAGWMRS